NRTPTTAQSEARTAERLRDGSSATDRHRELVEAAASLRRAATAVPLDRETAGAIHQPVACDPIDGLRRLTWHPDHGLRVAVEALRDRDGVGGTESEESDQRGEGGRNTVREATHGAPPVSEIAPSTARPPRSYGEGGIRTPPGGRRLRG